MQSETAIPILAEALGGVSDTRAGRLAEVLRAQGTGGEFSPNVVEYWPLAGGAPHGQTVRRGEETCVLGDLIVRDGSDLVGRQGGGDNAFPLQIRVFETCERQPLQVCVSPEGRRVGNSLFWFSVTPAGDAQVAVGIQHRVTRSQFLGALESSDLWNFLRVFPAPAGDAFFMAPGVVFAADAGCVLLEITHPSAARHTVSSWKAATGDSEQTVRQIRFAERAASRIRSDVQPIDRSRKIPLVNISPDFDVDELRLTDYFFGRTNGTAPHVLCPTDLPVVVETSAGSVTVPSLNACIVPAKAGDYHIKGGGEPAKVLRITPKSVFG